MKKGLFIIFISFLFIETSFAQTWQENYVQMEISFVSQYYKEALTYASAIKRKGLEELKNDTLKYKKYLLYAGAANYFTGGYKKAEPLYDELLVIIRSEQVPDTNYYGIVLSNIGLNYFMLARYELAEPYLSEVVEYYKKTKGEENAFYIGNLNYLAQTYNNMGLYTEGEEMAKKVCDVTRRNKTKDYLSYSNALTTLGLFYCSRMRYDEAETIYKEVVSLYKANMNTNSMDYATVLDNLGSVYSYAGKYDEAYSYSAEAQKLRKTLSPHSKYYASVSYNNIALIYYRKGDLKMAEKNFKLAYEGIKDLLGENNYLPVNVLSSLSMLYAEEGKYDEAEASFRKVLDNLVIRIKNYFPLMSEKEKEQFYFTLDQNFEVFNAFALKRYKEKPSIMADVYNYQLVTKALLLNSTQKVKYGILNSGDQSLIDLYKQWIEKRELLSQLYNSSKEDLKTSGLSIEKEESETNELEKTLSKKSAVFASAQNENKYTWESIKAGLKPGEAAVEIIRIRSFYHEIFTDTITYAALIVTPETVKYPQLVLLPNGGEMEKRNFQYYRNLIKQQLTDSLSYNAFWKPIAEKLKGAKKVYLSPDGIYNLVNLNALLNLETKKYIFEETEIHLVSNSKDILKLKSPTVFNKDEMIYLFGYPDYNLNDVSSGGFKEEKTKNNLDRSVSDSLSRWSANNFTELPGTKIEIENISKVIDSKNQKYKSYLKQDANEKNIKETKSPDILHIATHGYFIEFNEEDVKLQKNPLLRSGLALSGSNRFSQGKKETQNGEDGILTAYEAMNLQLEGTKLVVLSACETGLGKVQNGEGVYGLQRAFLAAGAKNIIMSLWKVNDEATQQLMTLFYKNLFEMKEIRPAFQKAQQTLKADPKFSAPYYWAAFVVVGE